MIDYFKAHPWKVIEEGFNPSMNEIAESVFSLGNGMMGQRGNLEESFSGHSLQGTYVGGVYYPDKTRVGWWKNGYPEYFAKVLNATYWSGLRIWINDELLDLAQVTVTSFTRELDMHQGVLNRHCVVVMKNGIELTIASHRFYSLINKEYSALQYNITASSPCIIKVENYLDGDVANKDSNYDEKFWDEVKQEVHNHELLVTVKTKKLDWVVTNALSFEIWKNAVKHNEIAKPYTRSKYASNTYEISIAAAEKLTFVKHCITGSSFHHAPEALELHTKKALDKMSASSFEAHLQMSAAAWAKKWETTDVRIDGDVKAQQAVRFNIYHLNQTYCGDDARLNIGPKGFTGEKYGGSTYWDTEAYCLPFFLVSADAAISRQLLVYRYKQLDKAIENATKLGFSNGAALYPMVTMNGEECHNEWEITFEEIHRNGAIAYAVYNYIQHTGDQQYLLEGGFEVLLGIARFWKQRVHWSSNKQRYEMHGVTGPNEYENNVNNNWYTSYIADWCMQYTRECAEWMQSNHPTEYKSIASKTKFEAEKEIATWNHIHENLYLPQDDTLGVFVQHDGFLEKELIPVKDLSPAQRPINQKWSWDRILRSVYIKQADVLQGLYFFEDNFDFDTHVRNFKFYEQFTVHESSLSPCVHSILAAKIGETDKAYEMYLRTARLDLDNYNNDTEDGLHITSMAGSYLSIVQGFGGLRIKNQTLYLNPHCPSQWEGYGFQILLNKEPVKIEVNKSGYQITNLGSQDITVQLHQGHEGISAFSTDNTAALHLKAGESKFTSR
jgi:maltose phosphorylase